MRKCQAWERALHQLRNKLRRTEFHYFWRVGDEVPQRARSPYRQNPARPAEAAGISDFRLIEVLGGAFQRDGNAVGPQQRIEVLADVPVERQETGTEVLMVIRRQVSGV